MLDQLTDGRVEFGTGRSNAYEQIGQGIDPRDTRAMWEESITMLPRIWQSDEFSWEGKFWKVPTRRVLPKPLPEAAPAPVPRVHADRELRRGGREGHRRAVVGHLRHHHPGRARQALPRRGSSRRRPSAPSSTSSGATTSTPSAGRTTRRRGTLAALSLKTFFGPDKPYIRDRVNAYEQLLESWGGVPDHLKADFGRWLRQSDEAHKEQAAQVGISLDSGPGAARAAFGADGPGHPVRPRHHHRRRSRTAASRASSCTRRPASIRSS